MAAVAKMRFAGSERRRRRIQVARMGTEVPVDALVCRIVQKAMARLR
jgi:hypothetical protein